MEANLGADCKRKRKRHGAAEADLSHEYRGRNGEQAEEDSSSLRKTNSDIPHTGRKAMPSYNADSNAHRQNLAFERLNGEIRHAVCEDCRSVSMSLKVSKSRTDKVSRCKACRDWRKQNGFGEVLPWLPVWYKDGVPQFHVPEELACLREGEKLLIQMASPYVPLKFLKGGAHGCKGHVCCFPQSVQEVVKELPRKKVDAIRVVRSAMNKDGEIEDKIFRIRRGKVMDALLWLSRYNRLYKDIILNENNLDWMEGKAEAELEVTTTEEEDSDDGDLTSELHLRWKGMSDPDINTTFGVMDNDPYIDTPKPSQRGLTEKLQTMADTIPDDAMIFPYVSSEPCNEYDDELHIFCMAFPWLYPGGIGDFTAYYDACGRISLEGWLKNLLTYHDGRFARDRAWCFFANNYANRRRNQSAGNYYVKDFHKFGPQSLEDLQEMVEKGDDQWINDICYFGGKVLGSVPYWRRRRDEIHSWIQYHVSQGSGSPTAFMTLSCAEFHWPDIKRLIKERCNIAKDHRWKEDGSNSTLVHEYTIVIQEYFQLRVRNWFDTVGKNVFGIKHYWLRFEFAPGRGQIHAHCLLILDNMPTQERIYEMRTSASTPMEADQRQAAVLEEWATQNFAMTANIPAETEIHVDITGANHPAAKNLADVDPDMLQQDAADLLRSCQNHHCNSHCMRHRKFL
jgi:hypothetical protein